MPVFNEEKTLEVSIQRVFAQPLVAELIAVDDGSRDQSWPILERLATRDPRVRIFRHTVNQGKGAALRTGLKAATAPFVIVQDADLEYNPAEYLIMLGPLLCDQADVVFGSRFQGAGSRRVLYFWHYVGNQVITLLSNMFTNVNLSDIESCYKAFRREVIQSIRVEEDRFGFEPEVTAKVARMNLRLYEVSISYHGRTYAEGKKIGWRDGVRAIWCIVKYGLRTS